MGASDVRAGSFFGPGPVSRAGIDLRRWALGPLITVC